MEMEKNSSGWGDDFDYRVTLLAAQHSWPLPVMQFFVYIVSQKKLHTCPSSVTRYRYEHI